MKNFILIALSTLILSSCANDQSNTTEAVQEPQKEETTITGSEPGHYTASKDAPYVGLWVVEFALGTASADKKELAKEFVGRWLNLKADNTFKSGKWQEQNNSGTWSFDAENKIIQINYSKEESISYEWKIQGQGDRMIWLGNTPNNKKGTQLSLNRESELPQQK